MNSRLESSILLLSYLQPIRLVGGLSPSVGVVGAISRFGIGLEKIYSAHVPNQLETLEKGSAQCAICISSGAVDEICWTKVNLQLGGPFRRSVRVRLAFYSS